MSDLKKILDEKVFASCRLYVTYVLDLSLDKDRTLIWRAQFPRSTVDTKAPAIGNKSLYNIIAAKAFDAALVDLLFPGGYLIVESDEKPDVIRRPPMTPEAKQPISKSVVSVVSVVTYATPNLDLSLAQHMDWVRQWCPGGRLHAWGPHDIAADFWDAHKQILTAERGAGYWLWKPYLILATLLHGDSEFVAYCDAGSAWRISWAEIEKAFLNEPDCHMVAARHTGYIDRDWTKRDVFESLGATDQAKYADTTMIAATCSVWRRNSKSIEFVRDWLTFGCVPGLITDEPNKLGKPNYPGFRDHRHDQSIYSLMIKQRGGAIIRNWEADVHQRVFR